MATLDKIPGRFEYAANKMGEVAANIRIGGRDVNVGNRVVPNVEIAYECDSGAEKFFLNLNRKSVTVGSEIAVLASGNLSLKVGNETDIWHINENGNFEWDIEFATKPLINIFEWQITKSDGVQFDRQRFLSEFAPWELTNDLIRPENVEGSYAIVCNKRHHIRNPVDGSTIVNYRTGKLGHIFRPLCIDANGIERWAELLIEGDVLRITIPQDYLDNATYPMILDPILGFDSIGNTNSNAAGDVVMAAEIGDMTEDGTLTEVFFYTQFFNTAAREFAFALWDQDAGSPDILLATGDSGAHFDAGSSVAGWFSDTASARQLVNGEGLYAGGQQEAAQTRRWWDDAGGTGTGWNRFEFIGSAFLSLPNPYTNSSFASNRRISIYIVYDQISGADLGYLARHIKRQTNNLRRM